MYNKIAQLLAGQVWMQSDVYEVAKYMRSTFYAAAGDCFEPDQSLHNVLQPEATRDTDLSLGCSSEQSSGGDKILDIGRDLKSHNEGNARGSTRYADCCPSDGKAGQWSAKEDRVNSCLAHPSSEEGHRSNERYGRQRNSQANALLSPEGTTNVFGIEESESVEELHAWPEAVWLDRNPLPAPTEREVHTIDGAGSVWRLMLVRK
jgi:hypothetical protein